MTDIKTPNAAQISRILGANGFTKATRTASGYKVTRETGQRIDFNLNQSIGARFPVVQVALPADDAARAVEVLTAAGYHAETANIPARPGVTTTHGAITRAAVLVISPEELADRAARKERAANADKLADEMVPATARVRVRLTTFPDHARRENILTRTEAVAHFAKLLRKPSTDVLDDDAIMRELAYRREDGVIGLYITSSGNRGNLLFFPVRDDTPAPVQPAPTAPEQEGEPTGPFEVKVFSSLPEYGPRQGVVSITTAQTWTQAAQLRDDLGKESGYWADVYVPGTARRVRYTPPAAEGTLIPAGQALGTAPHHSNNPDVVAAAAILTAAGYAAALVSGKYDEDDRDDYDTARGTGFMIDPRGNGRVNVHHLVNGVNCTPERSTWPEVKQYRRLFADTHGWDAPSMPGRTAMVIRTHDDSTPTPTEVRAAAHPVEEIVTTVKNSSRYGTIMEKVTSGEEIGRTIAYHAYGMHDHEINGVDWHAVRAGLLDLPSLEGHQVTVHADTRPTGKVTVQLWEKGHGVPAYSEETWNRSALAYQSLAAGMIRARQAALAERAALDALDDATLYEVTTTKGSIPQGAPQRLDGAAVRALFRRDREATGEERPHRGPYLEITRNGAMWRSVHTVFNSQGRRDAFKSWGRRAVPAVVADAGQAIMRAGYSLLSPVEKPDTRAFGPWVRPVPGHADRVIVSRVANGWHRRPDGGQWPDSAARWEEETDDYASILRANGWTEVEATDDGIIFTTQPF
ncbi:hypothetical protein [Streptomyces sp. NPDC059761]|uniref:hypothetical protein n=1 Tax=Streptomyces sp. NPDC059761 TaxID=3346937 RepID=UPI003647657B